MKKSKCMLWAVTAIILFAAIALSGCGKEEKVPSTEADTMTVVTSFYPMYVLTMNVVDGVDGVTVVNMAQPQTGCLHDYQLTTADMKTIDRANVLVVNGAGMESFLDKVAEQLPQLAVVTASDGIDLLEDTHTMHMHEEEEEKNPHVWVSPMGAAEEAQNIAVGLAKADPIHAEQYQQNAARFTEEMRVLKTEIQEKLEGISHRQLVTFHEAFPYFAQEFGLEIAAVIESEPGQEPGAAEIDEVMEVIRENQIPAIFVESQYADKTAQMIADETGSKLYDIDLVVTGDVEQTPQEVCQAYAKAMRKNLEVLMEALR